MLDIVEILELIKTFDGCHIHPERGLPEISSAHVFPEDLISFYQACGGLSLFVNSLYPIYLVKPEDCVVANTIFFRNVDPEEVAKTHNHISWSWYIIAKGDDTDQVFTIDLDQERLGWCYDSNFFLHPGNSPIIATSFTELLTKFVSSRGKSEFWSEIVDPIYPI